MAYFVTHNNSVYETAGANRLLVLSRLEESVAQLGMYGNSTVYSVDKFDEYCRDFSIRVENMPIDFFEMVNKYRRNIVTKRRTFHGNAYLMDRISAYYLRDIMVKVLPELIDSYGYTLNPEDEEFIKEIMSSVCMDVLGLEK